MGFRSTTTMLVRVTWASVILAAIMSTASMTFPVALPKCPDRCGDVQIPYPYGTTKGCYLSDTAVEGHYFINCTSNAYGQPQPMMGSLNVTSISMEGEIEIQMFNSIDCYDKLGTPLSNNRPWLSVPGFTVSVTKNKFVAVGCDTYAYLNGILNDQPFAIGCLSRCNNTRNIVNGTCSGIGCCQMDIPQDLTD